MGRKTKFVIELWENHYMREWRFADGSGGVNYVENPHDATSYSLAKAKRRSAEIRMGKEAMGMDARRFPRVVKVVTELIPINNNR